MMQPPPHLLDDIIERQPDKTAAAIADLLWKKSHQDWAVIRPLVIAQVAIALDIRRHAVEMVAFRETELPQRKGTGRVVDRVQLVRESRERLLDTFILIGGVRIRWRNVTAEQMEQRIDSLTHRKLAYSATIDQSVAHLRLAAENIRAVPGATCLDDVPEGLLTCFDGITPSELAAESAA